MGMDVTLYVRGIGPPDEEWDKKAAAWRACQAAGVDPPDELEEYFGYDGPDVEGRVVALGPALTEVDGDDENVCIDLRGGAPGRYYLIDIEKLPKAIKQLKVWMDVSI